MKTVQRLCSLVLVVAMCAGLLSGCNSIILNGDLSFQAYDPPPLISATTVSEVTKLEEVDYDKYNIGGVNAFYMLPEHANAPEDIADFKVLDYNSDGMVVYAYTTRFAGEDTSSDGLTVEQIGTAPAPQPHSADSLVEGGDSTTNVTVLMAYNPETRYYIVYHCELCFSSILAVEFEDADEDTEVGGSNITEQKLLASKINGKEEYYICSNGTGCVYTKDGACISINEYLPLMYNELVTQQLSPETYDIEIVDATVDGFYFSYLTISATPKDKGDTELNEDMSEEDVEDEEGTQYRNVCFYSLTLADKAEVLDVYNNYSKESIEYKTLQASMQDKYADEGYWRLQMEYLERQIEEFRQLLQNCEYYIRSGEAKRAEYQAELEAVERELAHLEEEKVAKDAEIETLYLQRGNAAWLYLNATVEVAQLKSAWISGSMATMNYDRIEKTFGGTYEQALQQVQSELDAHYRQDARYQQNALLHPDPNYPPDAPLEENLSIYWEIYQENELGRTAGEDRCKVGDGQYLVIDYVDRHREAVNLYHVLMTLKEVADTQPPSSFYYDKEEYPISQLLEGDFWTKNKADVEEDTMREYYDAYVQVFRDTNQKINEYDSYEAFYQRDKKALLEEIQEWQQRVEREEQSIEDWKYKFEHQDELVEDKKQEYYDGEQRWEEAKKALEKAQAELARAEVELTLAQIDFDSCVVFSSKNLHIDEQVEMWRSINGNHYADEAAAKAALSEYSWNNICYGESFASVNTLYEPYHYGDIYLLSMIDGDKAAASVSQALAAGQMGKMAQLVPAYATPVPEEPGKERKWDDYDTPLLIEQELYKDEKKRGNYDNTDRARLLREYEKTDDWVQANSAYVGCIPFALASDTMVGAASANASGSMRYMSIERVTDADKARAEAAAAKARYYETGNFGDMLTWFRNFLSGNRRNEPLDWQDNTAEKIVDTTSATARKVTYTAIEKNDKDEEVEVEKSLTEQLPIQTKEKIITSEIPNYELQWAAMSDPTYYATTDDLGTVEYYTASTDEETQKSTSVIQYTEGDTKRISDEDGQVPGEALIAQTYYSEGKEVLAFMTSEGIQFYSREGRNESTGVAAMARPFTKGRFITLAELAPNANAVYTVSQTGIVGEEIKVSDTVTVDTGNTSADDESSMHSLEQAQLMNGNELLIATTTEGLVLYNTDSGLSLSMAEGGYYAAIPAGGSNEQFAVFGYDSTDSFYDWGDIAWAKIYLRDIGSQSQELRDDMMCNYMQNLANVAVQYTHDMEMVDGKLQPAPKSDTLKALNASAQKLYYGTGLDFEAEYKSIVQKSGFGTVSDYVYQFAKELRTKATDQIVAMRELYQWANMVVTPFKGTNEELALEGLVLYAEYPEHIEDVLVELTGGIESAVDWASTVSMSTASAREELDRNSEYLAALDVVKARYYSAKGEDAQDWDTYLKGMLTRVSPFNAIDKTAEGKAMFYALSDINPDTVVVAELEKKLKACRSYRQVEELMVEYKLGETRYNTSAYIAQWNEFRTKDISDEKERYNTFAKYGFYDIIKELKSVAGDYLGVEKNEDATAYSADLSEAWGKAMNEIIANAGQGVAILDDVDTTVKDMTPATPPKNMNIGDIT